MDFADSTATTSDDIVSQGENYVTPLVEDHETTCWGCGLHVLVSPYAPAFKCFWCGAITYQNAVKKENKNFKWRRLRDRCFVGGLVVIMLFVIFQTSAASSTVSFLRVMSVSIKAEQELYPALHT